MSNRRILAVVAVLIAAGVVWAAARYTRWIDRFTGPSEKVTLQFLKDPVSVPAVTMETLDGGTLSSSDWRGKVVIVNFWATWCPPCRAEIPDLVALQEKYRDRVQIVGISDDEEGPEVVKRFAAQYNINYPLVMNTPELRKAFPGIYALPTTFMISQEGRVMQKHVGALNRTIAEEETRVLAGMSTNASIEYVEDSNKVLIRNAAQATKIPGIELDRLSPAARTTVLQKLNADTCTCGCGLTLAACRINDPTCSVSLPLAQKILQSQQTVTP